MNEETQLSKVVANAIDSESSDAQTFSCKGRMKKRKLSGIIF